MRAIIRQSLAMLALAAMGQAAAAGDVIAHPSLKLQPDEVRAVFLGERQMAGDTKLVPVDNSAAQTEFLQRWMRMEAQRYTALWVKKSFREGLPSPVLKGSDAEVIAFVRSTPGALGYVTTAPADLKVLTKF